MAVKRKEGIAVVQISIHAAGLSAEQVFEMSNDLPSADLGKAVKDVLNLAWRDGIDPTASVMVIRFA